MKQQIWLSCLYAIGACAGCSVMYSLRGRLLIFASIGGAIGWGVYLLCSAVGNDLMQFFLATIAITIYAEIMARIYKAPVTVFLIVALLPLVPGGGIYYTMQYAMNGETQLFLETGLHTLAIAASLAVGIFPVPSIMRLYHKIKVHRRRKPFGTSDSLNNPLT